MTLYERKIPFSGLLILLMSMMFIGHSHAQNWQESYVLNQTNSLSWDYPIGHFPHTIILDADPALGDVTVDLNDTVNRLNIDFVPVAGAVGIAEFIVEYWPNVFPPHPTQIAFRVYVVDSYITTERDYTSVEVNSTDNVILPLANDIAVGGDTLTIVHLPVVRHGTATIAGESILFTPDADFEGMAYLSYVVCDEVGTCEREEVSICVVPQGPLAANDTIYLSTDSRSPIAVYLPGTGFAVDQGPQDGDISVLSPDAWLYTPDQSFSGVEEISFVRDTTLQRTVMVDVIYQPKPNAFANDDIVYTRKNESVSFDVIANDVKNYPLNNYSLPEFGTLSNDSLGHFTYEPALNYTGAVTFTYSTCFFPNCETAEVIIYVGDMIPENTLTYKLVTQQDVPLVLNYEIPLDGYSFTINADPVSGDLELYPGYTTQQVACSDVSGFDLLVYEPSVGFTGNDHFEIYYCVGNSPCYLVKVDVEVQSTASASPCPCVDGCVWPGDVDVSGQVDMTDLLALGWHMGEMGTPRDYPNSTMWMGQYADDWNSMQVISETDVKYADSDGDGVISAEDAQLISDHYLKQHTLIPEITGLKADFPFTIVPLTTDLDSGDLAVLQIEIGDALNPVIDLHGVQFSLNLPSELVDLSTVNVDFDDQCWLSHDAPTIEMQVQPWDGRVDAAMTRVTGKPASGAGAISIMTFIIVDDIEGFRPPGLKIPLKIGVNGVSGINSAGRVLNLEGEGTTLFIGGEKPQQRASLDEQFFLYPNPVSEDVVNLHLNGDRQMQTVQVFDMTGRLMTSHANIADKHFNLPVHMLADGIYVARVVTSDGVVSKKFEVLRSAAR